MVHLGIVPDGNRRWCLQNNICATQLPEKWEVILKSIILECVRLKNSKEEKFKYLKRIHEISIYICSVDNMKRNDGTQSIICTSLDRIATIIEKPEVMFESYHLTDIKDILNDVCIETVGDLSILPKTLLEKLNNIKTKCQGNFVITLAINYDCYKDMSNLKDLSNVSYDRKQTDIDIVFRSGGEHRTSGFFPTKTVYSELYFCNKFWPEIRLHDINKCVKYLCGRNRRFGK